MILCELIIIYKVKGVAAIGTVVEVAYLGVAASIAVGSNRGKQQLLHHLGRGKAEHSIRVIRLLGTVTAGVKEAWKVVEGNS